MTLLNIKNFFLISVATVVFTFIVSSDANALSIKNVTQNADVIINCSNENSSDSPCTTNYDVESETEKSSREKEFPINHPSIDVVAQPVNENILGNFLSYFLITIGGASSSIFAYKTYKRLAASKTSKELEERIENLETIVTKD